MTLKSLEKAPDKTKERISKISAPVATQSGNHAYRKAIFAITCILTIAILTITTYGSNSYKNVAYASSVKGIGTGIYWDQTCTSITLSFDWGLLEAGSNHTLTIYVKNEGSSEISLFLKTSNWTPTASSSYISLNWNYSGQILKIDQVIPLELSLTVNSNISGITVFSFDTILAATSES